jgi:hypothetical protein
VVGVEKHKEPCTGESEGQHFDLAIEVVKKAEIIQVIRIETLRGNGTADFPSRKVQSFYLTNGNYIGEIDPLMKKCLRK